MPARCAACGTKIPLIMGRSHWCANCKTISCTKCRYNDDLKCQVCGTTKSGKNIPAVIFAVSFVMLLLGVIIGIVAAPDIYSKYKLISMAETPIDSASDGEFVKLQGILVANETIAIDSQYNDTYGHFRFIRHPVVLRDPGDGQCITLNLNEETIIYPGLHPSSTGKEGETSYYTNDSVLVLGTVYLNSSGAKWLRTDRLGPSGMPLFSEESTFPIAISVILPVVGAVCASVAWRWLSWKNEKIIAANGGVFKIKSVPAYEAPRGTPALHNRQRDLGFRYGFISLASFICFTIPVGLYYQQDPGSPLFQMPAAMFVMIVGLVLPIFAFMFLTVSYKASLEVVVDDTGMTAYYKNGKTRGLRWSSIKYTERPMAKPGRAPDSEEYILLKLENGQVESILTLTTQIAEAIEAAHKKHAPPDEMLEKSLLLKVLREKLASTEDPAKKAKIMELIDGVERPESEDGDARQGIGNPNKKEEPH